MTTKKKIRPHRSLKTTPPRYKTNQPAIPTSEEATEQSWIIFMLGIVVLLGIGLISAVTYILLLG